MNKITKNILALAVLSVGVTTVANAQFTQQKIGTNPTTITPSAVLDVESTTKGALLPRLALTSLIVAAPVTAPADALTVFNTATDGTAPNNVTPGYYYWDLANTKWVRLLTSEAVTNDWHVTGNAGTTPIATVNTLVGTTNYIGTSDANNVVVGVNGISRAIFTQQGSLIGGGGTYTFGATPPTYSLIWGTGHQLAIPSGSFANTAAVFGSRNTVNSSNGFTTGTDNIIGTSSVASMVSGASNTLGNQFQTSIVTGRLNTMAYTTQGGNGNIVAGQENKLSNSIDNVAPIGAIVGGYINTLTAAGNGFLLTGTGNTISGAMNNAAVVGQYNTPVDNSLFTVGNGTAAASKSNAMVVLVNGNVGINTTAAATPSNKLHVVATADPVRLEGLAAGAAGDNVVVANATGVLKTVTQASLASSLEPWQVQGGTTKATTNAENIYQTGNVSIGSQTPITPFLSNGVTITPKLSVTGDVASTGTFYTTTGKYADYVFEKYFDGTSKIDDQYTFKSLREVDAFIKKNKHLPGVTPISEVNKTATGYSFDITKLSIQSLEKIEELYLHTIEQQQLIEKQQTEIQEMKKRMDRLEKLLSDKK